VDDKTAERKPRQAEAGDALSACLIVLSGDSVGSLYKLTDTKYVIGRSPEAGIRLEDDGISRQHAKLIRYNEHLFMLKDLGSTNGTHVNGQPVKSHALSDGDRIQIGSVTILKFSYHDTLEERFQEHLYNSATRDMLTHAFNRRFFEEQLKREVSHAARHSAALSLMLLDIDHFKTVNDKFGHLAGDVVLREVAARVAATLRVSDVFCRIGGEEFAVLLRETPLQGAEILAERLRQLIEQSTFVHGEASIRVTVSLGVALYDRAEHPAPNVLLEVADKCLYEAKQKGRNRVAVAHRG
jgi:two-component system, cell cycle response regulator